MPTIKFPKNPNTDTAFVEQDDGTKNRALMIAPQDISTLELPNNPNSTKGYITVDGKKQRVILTADITGGGGGGSGLPDQTGHSGEFLTTDGTDASWAAVNALQNTATGTNSLTIGGTATSAAESVNIGMSSSVSGRYSTAIGQWTEVAAEGGTAVGRHASVKGSRGTAVGMQATASSNAQFGIAIGFNTTVAANYAIQLGGIGSNNSSLINSDANTFKVGNANGNYELMSADGTIPTARFTTDPSADGTYYPTLTISSGTPTRSWSTISALQNTATGTGGLTILGTASTVNYSINIGVNSKVSQTSGVAIGKGAEARAYQSSKLGTAIGTNAFVEGEAGVAIGSNSCSYANASGYAVSIGGFATAYDYGIAIGTRTQVFNTAPGAIQLGNCWTNNTSPTQNMDAHTFKVGLRTGTNYELLSSDGTIPTARLTKVNSTITLTAAGWSSNTQTVTVNGVTSTSVVLVAPDPSDTADYVAAGILCTSQTTNSLTFTATTTPTNDIDVNIVCL